MPHLPEQKRVDLINVYFSVRFTMAHLVTLNWNVLFHDCLFYRDILWFCNNAREFMAADKKNVIAIHCKGGKGRTGTIICVWMVDCGIFDDAKVSLNV